MLDLGFRAHDFGSFDSAGSLAKTASSFLNNACLHLAPYKVFENLPKPLNIGWAEKTREAFEAEGIRTAILGCYINPVHPDPDMEESGLKSFENGIEIAHALGNPVVATETGSLNPANVRCEDTWSERNICRFYKNVERLLAFAEKNNVVMALEAVADKNTIDSPQRMLSVMEEFNSPNLRVLFDAVNILPIHGLEDYASWYDEALDCLAPYICAMHIKDFVFADLSKEYPAESGHLKIGNIPVGEGLMPWKEIMNLYKKYNLLGVPMTLENFNPGSLNRSLDYIRSCCQF